MMTERFSMTLQSVSGHDVPATTRLRHALKCLLRSYGLRAIELRELEESEDREQWQKPGDYQPENDLSVTEQHKPPPI